MKDFIGSAYNKESIEEFIRNNSAIYKVELKDLYNILIKVFSFSISNRKMRLRIKTTEYVASIFKKNGHNFSAAFIALIVNMYNDNVLDDISSLIKTSYKSCLFIHI